MLKLQNIKKYYKIAGLRKVILDDISFNLEKGEIISLTGKSGSGKTTLLNVISGLTRPSSGSVFLEGRKIKYFLDIMPSRMRNRKFGFVFQSFRLLPGETAWSNILLPARISGLITRKTLERAEEILEKLGLTEYKNTRTLLLSGGQKQRTALARALINDPDIILADEPTANLDSETAEEIHSFLVDFARAGKSVLVVTHNEYMFSHSDKIYSLADGNIKEMRKKVK
ncbi:MAG: ABC transporter ATP-binding protein [Brevinematales bacterium]|jgi:ABC-type lipoprotein export system ATPase subunit